MKNLFYILFLLPMLLFSQKKEEVVAQVKLEDKQILRKGNDFYKEHKYVDAEVKYKKALKQNPSYENAAYNLGNSVYEQNRFKEALPQYEFVAKSTKDKDAKSQTFHNIGNTTMKLKQYDKAVAAYKNSLRLHPDDEETRYNLALAQKLLKDQQQKNKDNKDKNKDDKNKDKNKDKKKDKNDQNKDKKKDQGDNKDKDKDQDKGDDNKDKKDQNKGNNEQKDKQQQKPKPNQLSQQQMQQLLEAMNNEENKTQKKVNAQKARGKKVKNEKDW